MDVPDTRVEFDDPEKIVEGRDVQWITEDEQRIDSRS